MRSPLLLILCCCLLSGCSQDMSASFGRGRPADEHPADEKPRQSLLSPVSTVDAKTYTYPLRVSASGRYLVDQKNKAFRIQGDSAQSLIANLTYEEAQAYFADRQGKGFNTVNINLLEHKIAVKAPANRNGDSPFKKAGDFSTANDAYFAFADSIIDLAASKGMLVSLAAMYLGNKGGDEGWWAELTNKVNTREVCYKFGQYIGNRYKNRANILWVIGGDYMPPAGSEGEARLHRFLEGVKSAGAPQLWAGDWDAPCLSTDEKAFEALMDVNAVYTSGIEGRPGTTYGEARFAYHYSPPRPAYLKETGYENENWVPGDPTAVRQYEYWAVLGGATAGAFFGNRDVWEFSTESWWSGYKFGHAPWRQSLNSNGTYDMIRLGQLLDSVPWYDLVPSSLAGMKTLIPQGGGANGELDYIAAAASSDGRTLLAYVPPDPKRDSTFSVDMTALRASSHARWFDPSSGKYINVPESPFPNSGVTKFTIPGKNEAGARDWVLVIQVP